MYNPQSNGKKEKKKRDGEGHDESRLAHFGNQYKIDRMCPSKIFTCILTKLRSPDPKKKL